MKNAMQELARRGYINAALLKPAYGEGDEGGDGSDKGGDKGGDDKGGEGGEKGGDDNTDKGGKKPTDEEARLLKENMKRKEEAKKLKEANEALQKQFDALKASTEGLDIEEIRKLMKERQDNETKQLEAKGEFDKVKEQMRKQHAEQLAAMERKLAEYDGSLKSRDAVIEELTVGTSFAGSSFIKEGTTMSPKIARTIFGAHFDVAEGKTVGYDKPRGAKDRAPLVDGDGNPLAFDQALEVLVKAHEDASILLKAKGKPGSGSGTQGSGGKQADRQEPNLQGRDRIAAALKGKK